MMALKCRQNSSGHHRGLSSVSEVEAEWASGGGGGLVSGQTLGAGLFSASDVCSHAGPGPLGPQRGAG